MPRSILFSLLILILSSNSVAHDKGGGDFTRVIILSDSVGDVISSADRQKYHLFTQFKGFREAVVVQLPDSSCAVRITLDSDGALRDTLVRYSWASIMMMAERIDHFEELEKGEYVMGTFPPALKYSSGGLNRPVEFVPHGGVKPSRSVLSWQGKEREDADTSKTLPPVSVTRDAAEPLPLAYAPGLSAPRYYPSFALALGLRTISPNLSGLNAATSSPADVSISPLFEILPELLVTEEIGIQVDAAFHRASCYTSGVTLILYAHPFENPSLRPFLEAGGVWTYISAYLGPSRSNLSVDFNTAGGGVRVGGGIEIPLDEGIGFILDLSYEHIARKSDVYHDWAFSGPYQDIPVTVDLSGFRFGVRVKFE